MVGFRLLKSLQYVPRSKTYVARTARVSRAMEQERHFTNHIKPLAIEDHEGRLLLNREVLKAAAVALKEVKSAALSHRDVSGGGVYVGVGGVALTYIRMAQQLQRGFSYAHGSYLKKHDVSKCLKLAQQFLDDAESLMTAKRVTFLEGMSGVLAAQACVAAMQGQQEATQRKVQELEGLWASKIQGVLAGSECEVLYGRSGYLYSLAWLQQQLGQEAVNRNLIKEVVRHILDEGLAGVQQLRQDEQQQQQYHRRATGSSNGGRSSSGAGGSSSSSSSGWGLMYRWHDKRYLGFAHGMCGILYMLLHYLPLVEELDRERGGGIRASNSYVAAVCRSVDALAAAALSSGNLPTKVGDTEDVRVAWCHGGAGFVLTLLKASSVLGDVDGRYSRAATAAAADIWNRGLLKKGVGLCHGISGNGYALLAMARESTDPVQQQQWLAAAQAYAQYGARHWRELYDTPDRPASLFEGVAGAVNFWLDAIEHHPQQRWPGAEL